MTASFSERGDIAVITLDNPPVNGLGFATRSGIVHCVQLALDHPAIPALVLLGSVMGFSVGAAIREFNSPKSL